MDLKKRDEPQKSWFLVLLRDRAKLRCLVYIYKLWCLGRMWWNGIKMFKLWKRTPLKIKSQKFVSETFVEGYNCLTAFLIGLITIAFGQYWLLNSEFLVNSIISSEFKVNSIISSKIKVNEEALYLKNIYYFNFLFYFKYEKHQYCRNSKWLCWVCIITSS